MKTTNYFNTFIEVSEDCPVDKAEIPPVKESAKTAANIQFEMIYNHPYEYTSDDVVFGVFAAKNKVPVRSILSEREQFFSKGQPCLRSSSLPKRYGWGVHSDAQGRIAIYAIDSDEYRKLQGDQAIAHIKAMRSKRG